MSGTWILASAPLLPMALTGLNVMTWRRPRPSSAPNSLAAPKRPRTVSILIPARNEAQRIETAVRAAAMQLSVVEILVYEDQSTDATALVVERLTQEIPHLRVISGGPLPEGWVGKPHACQKLGAQARGEFLLFLDADVELELGAAEALMALLTGSARARVVTAMPRQRAESFFERLVIPLLVLTYTSWLPLRLVEWGRGTSTVAANGQLLMLRRVDYEELGGFASVRHEIVDDVAFCRIAKQSGRRVVFADGTLLASCRMYESAAEVWRGFSKNIYEGLGASPWALIVVLSLYLGCFVLPYVLLMLGLFRSRDWLLPGVMAVAAVLVQRSILALRYRQSLVGLVLHPFAVLALCAIALNSFSWSARGKITWAGRSYAGRRARAGRPASELVEVRR